MSTTQGISGFDILQLATFFTDREDGLVCPDTYDRYCSLLFSQSEPKEVLMDPTEKRAQAFVLNDEFILLKTVPRTVSMYVPQTEDTMKLAFHTEYHMQDTMYLYEITAFTADDHLYEFIEIVDSIFNGPTMKSTLISVEKMRGLMEFVLTVHDLAPTGPYMEKVQQLIRRPLEKYGNFTLVQYFRRKLGRAGPRTAKVRPSPQGDGTQKNRS
jgi:hypothetical protein